MTDETRPPERKSSSSSDAHRMAITPRSSVSMPVAGWVSVIVTAAVVGGAILLAFDRLGRVESRAEVNAGIVAKVQADQANGAHKRENVEGALDRLSGRVGGLEAKVEDLDDAVREAIKRPIRRAR